MSEPKKSDRLARFVSWVNGEREPKDQTLFTMEKRRGPRLPQRTEEEHEQRERHRLHKFLNWYPIAAGVICVVLAAVMMSAVLDMPTFGDPQNPTNTEVSQHYLEFTQEDTGATNAVTGMILGYRGFDTLGESCVLFLAVACVTLLLRRDGEEEDRTLRHLRQEEQLAQRHPDQVLRQSARILIPFIVLFAAYVLFNGEISPGGGFSGGTILGCALILAASAFGFPQLRRYFSGRTYAAVRTFGLLLYALLYGGFILLGANGLAHLVDGESALVTMPIDLAVGLVVACTVYGFYALFSHEEI